MTDLNLFVAFGAGVLSFVSPCTLPIYPGFLSYVTGVSVAELKQDNGMLQRRAILHTAFFLLGFSMIFVALGFSTSFIGDLFYRYSDALRQVGAIVVFFFGLVAAGLLRPQFLMQDKKFAFRNRPSGYLGSVLIGLGFAAGWTPCMGTILAAVLGLAVSNPDPDIPYMIAYVAGFAIPFFILSFFLGKLGWIRRHSARIMRAGGIVMIIMSVFLYFDWMTKISSFLSVNVFNGFQGF
ncbi:MAG TPA: cytochrome c biogenesis protein CcdA [Bacillales bacterium]|jgi:cytochrome c-type biogenesis protein|nr:cytochrome c biogenesis protein CcdA [Bacillales bacterium]